MKARTSKRGWIAHVLRSRRFRRLVPLAAVALIVWALFFPHESSTSGPVSLDQADGCPIPLPGSAREIQFFKRYQFNFFEEYVRFEAPPEDCLEHVDVVLHDWRKTFDDPIYSANPLSTIEEIPVRKRFSRPDVDWYDTHNIREGMRAGGGGSGVPMIWVDTRRGVFYYRLTD